MCCPRWSLIVARSMDAPRRGRSPRSRMDRSLRGRAFRPRRGDRMDLGKILLAGVGSSQRRPCAVTPLLAIIPVGWRVRSAGARSRGPDVRLGLIMPREDPPDPECGAGGQAAVIRPRSTPERPSPPRRTTRNDQETLIDPSSTWVRIRDRGVRLAAISCGDFAGRRARLAGRRAHFAGRRARLVGRRARLAGGGVTRGGGRRVRGCGAGAGSGAGG